MSGSVSDTEVRRQLQSLFVRCTDRLAHGLSQIQAVHEARIAVEAAVRKSTRAHASVLPVCCSPFSSSGSSDGNVPTRLEDCHQQP